MEGCDDSLYQTHHPPGLSFPNVKLQNTGCLKRSKHQMCVLFTGTFKVPNKHLCPAPYRHHQHQSHPFPLHSVKNDNSENHCQANIHSYNKSWERLQELQIRNGFIKYWKTFVNWRGELFFSLRESASSTNKCTAGTFCCKKFRIVGEGLRR